MCHRGNTFADACVYDTARLFVKHIEESENLLYALCDDNNINANIDGYVYDTKTNIITLEERSRRETHGFPGCLAGTEFQLYPVSLETGSILCKMMHMRKPIVRIIN